jgi:broad specificity phosphatase PhoE
MPIKPRYALITLILVSFAAFGLTQPNAHPNQRELTAAPTAQPLTTDVVYVVRHADTLEGQGQNPDLSPAGVQRAQSLANMLQDESLSAIYVTNTARSIQTGAAVASQFGIGSTIYAPFDAEGLAQTITNLPGSNATLVVAHSNTVPMIIAALGGPQMEDLEETEFDRLFAVVLSNGKHTRTLELHYE